MCGLPLEDKLGVTSNQVFKILNYCPNLTILAYYLVVTLACMAIYVRGGGEIGPVASVSF